MTLLKRTCGVRRGLIESLVMALVLFSPVATSAEDTAVVKQRIYEHVLSGKTGDRARRAEHFLESQQSDGTWKDIDYGDQERAGWPTSRHLSRLGVMARALREPGGQLTGNRELRSGILRGLDHWLAKDYRNPNWWWNEIGVPKSMGVVLVLMEKDLSRRQRDAGVKIMKRSVIGKTAQNLVWLAGNQVTWGCLAGDTEAVKTALNRMAQEIMIAPGDREGVKINASFWQHGRCLYSGGYGLSFSRDTARFAWLARGTRFAFPGEKISVISSCILDGQQWMVRGKTLDYGAEGRGISRPYAGRAGGLIDACRQMMVVDTKRRAEFAAFIDRLENGPTKAKVPLVGNRHFWKSDFMTHQRRDWYTSVRMHSVRVDNTDNACNDEGLLNHLVADGVTYIMRRGDEYEGIFPVWDWRRVPGITAEQAGVVLAGTPRRRGTRGFVGGVSDGYVGVAAMDFARGELLAKKSWFFFDREFVALGAGIQCASEHPVVTSVNQCHLKGEVVSGGKKLGRGTHKRHDPSWVHHDGVGYVFPNSSPLAIRAEAQVGSWHRLRHASSKNKVVLDVFSLWIDHGKNPRGAEYAYVVAPGVSAGEMPVYVKNTGIDVVSNTAHLQAVYHKQQDILGAVFLRPGKVSVAGGMAISVDQPCLVLARPSKKGVQVSLSNPRNAKLAVNLVLTRKGVTTKRKIDLPDEEMAGSSVTFAVGRDP